MSNMYGTIAPMPIDDIWHSISNLSNNAKVELIKRLSESILSSNSKPVKSEREKFLSLAGAWNDDAKADDMDKAALSLRNDKITRNLFFD